MRPIMKDLGYLELNLHIFAMLWVALATLSPITSYSTYAIGLIATQFAMLGITDIHMDYIS